MQALRRRMFVAAAAVFGGLWLLAQAPADGSQALKALKDLFPEQPAGTAILELRLEKLGGEDKLERISSKQKLKTSDKIRLRFRSIRDGYLKLFFVEKGVKEPLWRRDGKPFYVHAENPVCLPPHDLLTLVESTGKEQLLLEFAASPEAWDSAEGGRRKVKQLRVRGLLSGSDLYLVDMRQEDAVAAIELTLSVDVGT